MSKFILLSSQNTTPFIATNIDVNDYNYLLLELNKSNVASGGITLSIHSSTFNLDFPGIDVGALNHLIIQQGNVIQQPISGLNFGTSSGSGNLQSIALLDVSGLTNVDIKVIGSWLTQHSYKLYGTNVDLSQYFKNGVNQKTSIIGTVVASVTGNTTNFTKNQAMNFITTDGSDGSIFVQCESGVAKRIRVFNTRIDAVPIRVCYIADPAFAVTVPVGKTEVFDTLSGTPDLAFKREDEAPIETIIEYVTEN